MYDAGSGAAGRDSPGEWDLGLGARGHQLFYDLTTGFCYTLGIQYRHCRDECDRSTQMIADEDTRIIITPRRHPLRGILRVQASQPSRRAAWTLTALYASGIFLCSSLSSPPLLAEANLPHLDKLCHFFIYGGLTFLLMRALRVTCPTSSALGVSLWGLGLAVGYGAVDELHQAFVPGRVMSLFDLFADAAGAGIVASLWPRLHRRWPILLR